MRDALRQVRLRPAFTVTVATILAVGIGANVATFSLVKGLMLQPLSSLDADAVMAVGRGAAAGAQAGVRRPVFPILMPEEWRRLEEGARSFVNLAAYQNVSIVWDGREGLERLAGTAVTPAFFEVFRTSPWLGRAFRETDTAEGADGVVLLSHGAWTGRFGSDPDVVGGPVELNGEPYTVIGVLPEGFAYPSRAVDLWIPLVLPAYETPRDEGSPQAFVALNGIGRLRREVSAEQAEAEARTLLAPRGGDRPMDESEVSVRPIREELARPFRAALLMLGAATGLVLLVACANVAGLLLVRGVVRQRELAIRGALGAGRGRIARQLLVESVLLSFGGGAVGVAVAAGTVRAAAGLVPDYVPGLAGTGVDGAVLVFAAGLSVVTGVVFGTAPALAGSRVSLVRTLNEGGVTAAAGFGRLRMNRIQAALAVAQVAVALVLLVSTGLLVRSFVARVTFDHGYDPTDIAPFFAVRPGATPGAFSVNPSRIAENYAATRGFVASLVATLERVQRLPEVEAVALAHVLPIFPATAAEPIGIAGRPPPVDPRDRLVAGIRTVSSGYASVLRLPVQAGRFFTDRDEASGRRVVVASESFARRAFGNAPAVGQQIVRPAVAGDSAETWEVIGVVDDIATSVFGADVQRLLDIYVPILEPGMTEQYAAGGYSALVLVRSDRTPLTVLAFLREAYPDIHSMPPGRLDALLSFQAAQPRFYAMCAGISGAVALLLAAFGLYGVLGHWVAQRRREIGVRMALGATRGDVVRLVVRQGGGLVVAGVILGLAAAAATTRVVEHMLFDVTPVDPLTFAAVTAMLVAGALPACWLPARRAAGVDPMDALRDEG